MWRKYCLSNALGYYLDVYFGDGIILNNTPGHYSELHYFIGEYYLNNHYGRYSEMHYGDRI